ncbi:MAG: hypothetical protein KAY22_19355 [Rhizorhabdus sp.]|uniref:hypothetical protein n=1 Tax=Rhizorhabdus sp. TaxID=1968843 RepID=UPI001B3E3148|nr:hypothetical protein [Rhizorhabdus sp.]MBP8234456.1 hypothetical protein [Rhizorhabdus sp.]
MAAVAQVLAAALTLAGSERTTTRVEVDGKVYRVAVQDGAVLVANKSAVVIWSLEERDRQRTAVFKATGCKIVDELPAADAILRGRLSCPTGAGSPAKP